jgi:hypothetical protein
MSRALGQCRRSHRTVILRRLALRLRPAGVDRNGQTEESGLTDTEMRDAFFCVQCCAEWPFAQGA